MRPKVKTKNGLSRKERFRREWLATRPQIIKVMSRRLKPWHFYRLWGTGQVCAIYSLSEDNTVTVSTYNAGLGEWVRVFGIKPNQLIKLSSKRGQKIADSFATMADTHHQAMQQVKIAQAEAELQSINPTNLH